MKIPKMHETQIRINKSVEGETLESKIVRALNNNAKLEAESPIIFTERKDGVAAQYDIRADKWEIAAIGGEMISNSFSKKREEAIEERGKVIDLNPGNEGTPATN